MSDIPFNKDITYFAKTHFRGTDQIFGIKRRDRRQHMYVLGKSGSGKSVMLENMIIQNIRQGEGVCVIDPHGELIEKIITAIPRERAEDVVYLNPADTDFPVGFNPLQLDDPKYKHLVASGLMGIFTKIWANAWSSRMEYILNNAILALLDTPNTTLLGIPRVLVDKDYRQYIIGNLKDPVVKAFWVHEYEAWRDQFRNEAIAPIQNKVGQFLSSNIVRNVVGQTKSTINIFDIMNQKKIFLVNVSKGRVGEDNSALLGAMLITKIQLSAMERVRIPENEREDFYLYVDEFQNFVTDSFASILSEARKYRLSLTMAHQYIKQLESESSTAVRDAVFGNVGTMIIFRVGADDAESLEPEFDPEFVIEDFVNLPNYHIYTKLMVDGVTSRPFSAKTLPPIPVNESKETEEYIIDTSRKLYTRPRALVEEDINRWSSTVPGQGGSATGGGEEPTAGKFKAECTNDQKVIYVPFEPDPGVPIYCKECLFKIKQGELEPKAGFRPPKEKKDTTSYDALAALGIEFTGGGDTKPKIQAPQQFADKPKPTFTEKPKLSRPVENKREPLPPMGVIKADKNDLPQPGKFSQRPKEAPQQKTQEQTIIEDEAVPVKRVVRPPIHKERKAPDTKGLRDILNQALSSTIGSQLKTREKNASPEPEFIEEEKKPQETISLSELKTKAPAEPVFAMSQKEARSENIDLLKNIISQVETKDAIVDSDENEANVAREKEESLLKAKALQEEKERKHQEELIQAKRIAEQKEQERIALENKLEQEKSEKERIEKEREEIEAKIAKEKQELQEKIELEKQQKQEAEEKAIAAQKAFEEKVRALEEEKKRKIEEEQTLREAELKRKEAQEKLDREETVKKQSEEISDAPKTTPVKKEVPEDLLKQILE